MIICPNCEHPNPDEATQCEACYTPLPQMSFCPNCGASVQADSTFCGQCGSSLQPNLVVTAEVVPPSVPSSSGENEEVATTSTSNPSSSGEHEEAEVEEPATTSWATFPAISELSPLESPLKEESPIPLAVESSSPPTQPITTTTRLQVELASLLHIQTNTKIELPLHLSIVHLGKPNDHIPPDIDVSGFPESDVVSRVHADIRVEGGIYYLEDTGSSNGTYINHTPLLPGNRHRLRSGDRISLGKGDKVTFIFQMS